VSDAAPVLPGNAGPDDYPRMLYHPSGDTMIVADPAAHDAAHQEGWATTPSPVHQRPSPSAMPILSGADPSALLLRAVLEAVLDERGLTKAFTDTLMGSPTSDEPVPHLNLPRRR